MSETVFQRNRHAFHWIARCYLALVLCTWFAAQTGQGNGSLVLKEYQIKAGFLYNFGKYVEWPDQNADSKNSPFLIGVFGENRFGKDLETIVSGRLLRGREVRVVYISNASELGDCQILFLSASEDRSAESLLKQLGSRPVLTVGESERFKRAGGMITFFVEGEKVRFDINVATAQKANLKVGAQLQKLARNTR